MSETLDPKNRIQATTNRRNSSGPVFARHSYTFDAADRRDYATREDGRRNFFSVNWSGVINEWFGDWEKFLKFVCVGVLVSGFVVGREIGLGGFPVL